VRVYKEITRKDQVIENEICNNCGQSMVVHRDRLGPEIEGLSEVTISGGYFSKHLGDSIEYKFSLCEKCLSESMLEFKIPPEVRSGYNPKATWEDIRALLLENLDNKLYE